MQSSTHIQPPGRFLPLLLLLFVGSGCAALIYEIVWFQMLELVIGVSAISLGVLLATFMGGMCLGSLLAPRLFAPHRHPLRVYALLELGIGLCGIAILYAIPALHSTYAAWAGPGMAGYLLRGAISALCLLPPTLLMGATLPAIARWVQTTPQGVSWLGFFYGGNIAGAVFGSLLAGFYLLRVYDMPTATFVAAAINATVALLGFGISRLAPHTPPPADSPAPEPSTPGSRWAYPIIALSGASALGAEVIWTRLLSLMLGATVYTFSIILAVFLVGLGIGSAVGASLARTTRPQVLLGVSQALLTAAIAWAAYTLTQSLPYWPIDPTISRTPWHNFQLDLLRCAWAILPAALLWGASFPAALAGVATGGKDAGRAVGGIYAANTVGAILGAVVFSTLVIRYWGTSHGQQLLLALAAAAALLAFLTPIGSLRPRSLKLAAGLTLCLFLGGSMLLARTISSAPWQLIAFGRLLPTTSEIGKPLYVGEGMNSSVAVTELAGVRYFHVSGKCEASSGPQDMRLQRMLGHIPALVHPAPQSVLIVGCGAGVTAGCFVVHPEIQKIEICELEPLVPQAVAPYFALENHFVLKDPRLHLVYDDARHHILTTRDKFDIITSDPIHPWVKGAATLYTREYFEMVKAHLNPGGVVTQWVPLYESNTEAVKSQIRTFFDVFPNGTIWSNDAGGEGYDILLLGQDGPTRIDLQALHERMSRPDYVDVVSSLEEVGFASASELLATCCGEASQLEEWLRDAQPNTDGALRLQYLAGMGLNSNSSIAIFDDMMLHHHFPDDLFIGPEDLKQELRMNMARNMLRQARHTMGRMASQ